ncbi:hypothetical protein SPRG_20036, partial [Saprolegnia parasitica CBS 223.65]
MPKAHCPGTCPTVQNERREDCSRCRRHQFMPPTTAPLRPTASFMPRLSTMEMDPAVAEPWTQPSTRQSTSAPVG